MALGTGGISIRDLQVEFGTSANSLSQFYRGGGIVPNTPRNAGIPTSGLIALSHFRGASNAEQGEWHPRGAGWYSFRWPLVEVLTVYMFGASGGGGGCHVIASFSAQSNGISGTAGTDTYLQCNGFNFGATAGQGGQGGYLGGSGYQHGATGAAGAGFNGDANFYGNGAPGGDGGTYPFQGQAPGGAGGQGGYAYRTFYRNGGNGGFAANAVTALLLGQGGLGGENGGAAFPGLGLYGYAGNGSPGYADFYWS